MEVWCCFPFTGPCLWVRILWVVDECELPEILSDIFRNSFKSMNRLSDLTQCTPYFIGHPQDFRWHWFSCLNPGTTNHHEPYFWVFNFLFCSHNFQENQIGKDEFIFFQQASTKWLIEKYLELVNNIFTTIFLSRSGFFYSLFEQVNIEF